MRVEYFGPRNSAHLAIEKCQLLNVVSCWIQKLNTCYFSIECKNMYFYGIQKKIWKFENSVFFWILPTFPKYNPQWGVLKVWELLWQFQNKKKNTFSGHVIKMYFLLKYIPRRIYIKVIGSPRKIFFFVNFVLILIYEISIFKK